MPSQKTDIGRQPNVEKVTAWGESVGSSATFQDGPGPGAAGQNDSGLRKDEANIVRLPLARVRRNVGNQEIPAWNVTGHRTSPESRSTAALNTDEDMERDDYADAGVHTQGRHALEHPVHGPAFRSEPTTVSRIWRAFALNLTAPKPSSCRRTPSSSKRFGTLWDSTL